jgi:hypothetical protein
MEWGFDGRAAGGVGEEGVEEDLFGGLFPGLRIFWKGGGENFPKPFPIQGHKGGAGSLAQGLPGSLDPEGFGVFVGSISSPTKDISSPSKFPG